MLFKAINLPKENEGILEENGDTWVHSRLLCKIKQLQQDYKPSHLIFNLYYHIFKRTVYCKSFKKCFHIAQH